MPVLRGVLQQRLYQLIQCNKIKFKLEKNEVKISKIAKFELNKAIAKQHHSERSSEQANRRICAIFEEEIQKDNS